MGRIKKQVKISKVFMKFIIAFCVETIALLSFWLIILNFLFNEELIYPANYYENYILSHKSEIEKAESVESLIPEGTLYAVYENNGTFVEGNIKEEEKEKVWNGLLNNHTTIMGNYYKIISRDSQICIILYKIQSSYSNAFLQKYLPSVDIIMIGIFILAFLLNVLRISKKFDKVLSPEIMKLNEATKQIQEESLEFDMQTSNIIEINQVLLSLTKLKDGLKSSLNQQWKMESLKREQIAALGHDLKTPITIVKGNIELLEETELQTEQEDYVKDSLSNIQDMQYYINKLLEINSSDIQPKLVKKEIDSSNYLEHIVSNMMQLAKKKNIRMIIEGNMSSGKIMIDEALMKRAIVNILDNAIEYAGENTEILIRTIHNGERHAIIIEDEGEGFTKEALELGTEQFYRSDKSRISKTHHGMGLYITKNILHMHGGEVILGASAKLGGAKVELWFL